MRRNIRCVDVQKWTRKTEGGSVMVRGCVSETVLFYICCKPAHHFHSNVIFNPPSSAFTIRNITLSVEPSAEVPRGTNVTIRCTAVVSSSGQEPLNRKYSIYQGSNNIYTKNTITSEDLLYLLPDARVSNTGKYKCAINIEGKNMQSDATKLTVTGRYLTILAS